MTPLNWRLANGNSPTFYLTEHSIRLTTPPVYHGHGDIEVVYVIVHVLSNLLLIYICKLHWNPQLVVKRKRGRPVGSVSHLRDPHKVFPEKKRKEIEGNTRFELDKERERERIEEELFIGTLFDFIGTESI